MDKQPLWWNYVSGATRYLNDSLSATSKHRVLLLEEGHYMEYYFHIMQEKLRQLDSSVQMEMGMADEWAGDHDVGENLMNLYTPQVEYHPMDGPRAEFIAKNNLLSGRVLIIRQIERRPDWLNFAIDYAKHSQLGNGLLILTYCGPCPLANARKGIATLKWDSYISVYDMQLFASYCIAELSGLSLAERNYITQIASRMAGADPELCGVLSTEVLVSEAFATDSLSLFKWLEGNGKVDGKMSLAFVESVLWEAQIQTVFPVIEQARRRFIESYNEEMLNVLPQRDEFGNELKYPKDMELRHMWYYCFKNDGFHSLEDERAFRLVYEARNNLAHLRLLHRHMLLDIFALEKSRPGVAQ